jgi:tetratricopeptide (TPR) repeat protein
VKGFSQAAEKLRQAQAVAPDQPFWKAARAELAARAGVGGFGPALELARNAVAADADCLECRAILGYILVTREWNWAEGEKQLAMVIQSPGASSQARLWSAQLLNLRRRHPEAHRQLDLALSKDPTNARLHVMKGVTFYLQRNCDQAEVEMRQASSLDPGVVGPAYWMYRCAIFRDDPMQVAARWSTHYAVFGGFTNDHSHQYRGLLMETAQKGGKQGLARRLLLETSEVEAMRQHRYERAAWKLWVGDRAAALEELEAAVTARPFNLVYVAADPTLAQLRDQPRFRATLAQLRLAD